MMYEAPSDRLRFEDVSRKALENNRYPNKLF